MSKPPVSNRSDIPRDRWRITLIVLFVVGSFGLAMSVAPIPQDLAYHRFVDPRGLLGIPNFGDVMSNLPFLVVGLLGIRVSIRECPASTKHAWILFFVAVAFVGFGSGYYHWSPSNNTLVWDRLPMTAGFMAFFAVLMGEYFDRRFVNWLLYPAVVLGASSVLYWHMTDDLRFYAWVQFMPLGVIALLLILFPARFKQRQLLFVALGWYVLAKVLEHFDSVIFDSLANTVSGHTLKHLAAAASCYVILSLLRAIETRQAATSMATSPAHKSTRAHQ